MAVSEECPSWDAPWSSREKLENGEDSVIPTCVTEVIPNLYLGDSRLVTNKGFPEWCQNNQVSLVVQCAPGEITAKTGEGYIVKELGFRKLRRDEELLHKKMNAVGATISEKLQAGEAVVVNCNVGADRSVTVVTSFLLKYYDSYTEQMKDAPGRTLFEILWWLKAKRSVVAFNKVERVLGNYQFTE